MKKLLALNFFPAFTPPASGGELRLVNMDVDLVLIGPDEDKLPITEKNVYYYGCQDRNVVLDALASCLAVVSMRTESFSV